MFVDIYLKAITEENYNTVLEILANYDIEPFDLVSSGGSPNIDQWAFDEVGTIYEPSSEFIVDEWGEVIYIPVAVEGIHANLRICENHPQLEFLLEDLAEYIITPATPQRVWA